MSKNKVDDFLAKLEMKVHPDISEDVKWGGPSFYSKGDIATFSLRVKDTVTLIFHQAEGLDGGDLLESATKGKAYAKFKNMSDEEAKSKNLQSVIKQWMKLMGSDGICLIPLIFRKKCKAHL